MLSNRILDDDLFVVIGARPKSVSYSGDMAQIPSFLQSYFATNNIMMIYPEQFGESPELTSFVDPLASDVGTGGSALLQTLKRWRRR